MEHAPEVQEQVKRQMQERESPRALAKPPPPKKKNKPMSKTEQESKIAALKDKKDLFERHSSGSQEPPLPSKSFRPWLFSTLIAPQPLSQKMNPVVTRILILKRNEGISDCFASSFSNYLHRPHFWLYDTPLPEYEYCTLNISILDMLFRHFFARHLPLNYLVDLEEQCIDEWLVCLLDREGCDTTSGKILLFLMR